MNSKKCGVNPNQKINLYKGNSGFAKKETNKNEKKKI